MPERHLRPRYGRVEISPETRGQHRGGVRQAPLASHAHWEAYCEPCDWVGEQWGGTGRERAARDWERHVGSEAPDA